MPSSVFIRTMARPSPLLPTTRRTSPCIPHHRPRPTTRVQSNMPEQSGQPACLRKRLSTSHKGLPPPMYFSTGGVQSKGNRMTTASTFRRPPAVKIPRSGTVDTPFEFWSPFPGIIHSFQKAYTPKKDALKCTISACFRPLSCLPHHRHRRPRLGLLRRND